MPVPGLNHLGATAIQVVLEGKPVIILAAYLSPSRPLIGADLAACFGGGLPVLVGADLNDKQMDWNSRLSTRRGKHLRDYADENSYMNVEPDSPTTILYNPSATPDVFNIVITKNLSFPVYLTSLSALSSDHLPVLIDTACPPSFNHPPDRPDFTRTDWVNFQTQSEEIIQFNPELNNESVENYSGAVLKALASSTPKRLLVTTNGLR